ncbi:serine/threonine-protein kinase [Rathayibacter oskolensis]|uniref:serine/threonine-protein kinase n=1 Tax=Rathayibacter oskolensis TaxID=1891671 RepID=UPI00265F3AFD|nr:serine/threonine-protein kinase [Rathayibacter oskolensis]WKK73303.1 serine/threonine-protein kinase [Rathayibacter oskolensis]
MAYRRVSRINAGGQGEVWRGVSASGEDVAIKFMHLVGGPTQQDEDRRRFRREITCQTSLVHKGIVRIHASNVEAAEPFLVMDLADESLRDLLVRHPNGLDEEEAVRLFNSILDAVSYAHSEGVIHRDLKPENVLLIDGNPALSDFGLGRRMFSGSTSLTMSNVGWGSYAYSAPEQFTDLHGVDASADVFALGRILYELFTGKVAAHGIDFGAVPPSYRYVIMTATQINPARRFASATEMLREISILSSPSTLLAPGERAREIIREIAAGDNRRMAELTRLLIDHSNDVELFMKAFVQTPETVLSSMARERPDEFREVMRIFDGYAEGSHPWSFTDTLAFFLRAAFRASNDIEVRSEIIARLLDMGYQHNRWYVRDIFVEVVSTALRDATYSPIVARILRENPPSREFVRAPLLSISLPQVVREALAA